MARLSLGNPPNRLGVMLRSWWMEFTQIQRFVHCSDQSLINWWRNATPCSRKCLLNELVLDNLTHVWEQKGNKNNTVTMSHACGWLGQGVDQNKERACWKSLVTERLLLIAFHANADYTFDDAKVGAMLLELWKMDMQVAFLHFQWVPQLFVLNYSLNLSCSCQRPFKHQNVYLNANESSTIGQKRWQD